MSKPFRPLLAAETPEDLNLLKSHFPMFASYKIDGIRAIIRDGVLVSRTMKPIPSAYAQSFCHPLLEGFDGELLAQQPIGPTIYHDTYSAAMTHGSTVPLYWHLFDRVAEGGYYDRTVNMLELLREAWGGQRPHIMLLGQHVVEDVDDILTLEAEALDLGYEGLILRRPDGIYKQGRSTLKEGILVKVAREKTSEAVITGFEEMMHNENPAEIDARGFTKRTSHQDNLRPSGMMGAIWVKDIKTDLAFKIGTGFDHALREEIWKNQDKYLGKLVKYKYKPYGVKELPRQPAFIGFRSPDDM